MEQNTYALTCTVFVLLHGYLHRDALVASVPCSMFDPVCPLPESHGQRTHPIDFRLTGHRVYRRSVENESKQRFKIRMPLNTETSQTTRNKANSDQSVSQGSAMARFAGGEIFLPETPRSPVSRTSSKEVVTRPRLAMHSFYTDWLKTGLIAKTLPSVAQERKARTGRGRVAGAQVSKDENKQLLRSSKSETRSEVSQQYSGSIPQRTDLQIGRNTNPSTNPRTFSKDHRQFPWIGKLLGTTPYSGRLSAMIINAQSSISESKDNSLRNENAFLRVKPSSRRGNSSTKCGNCTTGRWIPCLKLGNFSIKGEILSKRRTDASLKSDNTSLKIHSSYPRNRIASRVKNKSQAWNNAHKTEHTSLIRKNIFGRSVSSLRRNAFQTRNRALKAGHSSHIRRNRFSRSVKSGLRKRDLTGEMTSLGKKHGSLRNKKPSLRSLNKGNTKQNMSLGSGDVFQNNPFHKLTCYSDYIFSRAQVLLGQTWARLMVDSSGHIGSGMIDFEVDMLGVPSECLEAQVPPQVGFQPQYCVLTFAFEQPFPKAMKPTKVTGMSAGICIPDSCHNKDLNTIINTIISQYSPVPGLHLEDFYCSRQDDAAGLGPGGVAVLVLLGMWGLLVILATLFQAWCDKAESPPLPSQRQSPRRKPVKVVAYHRTIEEEEEEQTSAQDPCETVAAVVDETGVRGDDSCFEDSPTDRRCADEKARITNPSGTGMDKTTVIPDTKQISTDGGQTDIDPSGIGIDTKTNGIDPSTGQTDTPTHATFTRPIGAKGTETDMAHSDTDMAHADTDMTNTDTGVTYIDTDMAHADTDMTYTDTGMTYTDTDMAHADTDMTHTHRDMAHADTDMTYTDTGMTYTDTDMTHTYINITHTDTVTSHIYSDIAHTDTDMTHVDTDITQSDTDMTHTDTDMAHTDTDMAHTDTDMAHTDTDMAHTETDTTTIDTNSEFSDAASDHTNTHVKQRHHETISFAELSPQHSVSRPSHTEENEQIWETASGDSGTYLSLIEETDNDDEKSDRECDEHTGGVSSRSPNESLSLVDDYPDGVEKNVSFSETLTASLSTIEECSIERDKDSVHTIPEKSIPLLEDSCHGTTNIGPARGILRGTCKTIPSVVQDCSELKKARGWRRAARCLSLQHNIPRLLKETPEDKDMSCLHGIRVLSMAWAVLINSVIYQGFFARNMWKLLQQWRNSNFVYPVISNGLLSLDSLLALSGLVAGYSCCRRTPGQEAGHRQAGLRRWLYILLHRYIRVVSVLILVAVAYVTLFPALTEGPMSMRESPDSQACISWGWMYVLLINNMASSSCMSWTWLQAVDFQLLLLATPVLYVLHRKPLLAYVMVAVLVAVSCAISAAVTSAHHLPSSQFILPRLENMTAELARLNRFETNYFTRPWAHAGAYLPSLLLGHYLQTSASPRPRLPFTGLVAGCLLAGGGAAGALWGAGTEMAGGPSLSTAAVALFNGVQRTVWGAAVGWVVLVCSTGHGGPVRAFLSWTGWRPLSRLALLVYILHPAVILAFTSNLQQLPYLDGGQVLGTFIPVLGYSFVLAAVLALGVQMPLTALLDSDGVLVLF